MEKKFMITMLAVIMVLGFSSASMSRMGGGHHGLHGGHGGGCNFIDEDYDGICDNQGSGCRHWDCAGYVDKDGDGDCDYRGRDHNFIRRGYRRLEVRM